MEIEITFEAKKDLEYWRKSGNTKILNRIKELLESIQKTPFKGIGKPEALKYDLLVNGPEELTKITD